MAFALFALRTTARAQVVTEFSAGMTAFAGPSGIAAGPDGNLWFTEAQGGNPIGGHDGRNRIGRITPTGIITEFSTGITVGAFPIGITAGPDGNLWFAESAGRIGRITPLGVITEFSAGISAGAGTNYITAGPDGNMWFTEWYGNRIGRITLEGVVTEFSVGISYFAFPCCITAGPDGNLWFIERGVKKIGRITPLGVVTEFGAGLSASMYPGRITAGPDGNLWFTEFNTPCALRLCPTPLHPRIGRITPEGDVTEISVGSSNSGDPIDITAGPDGNLWFMWLGYNRIGRITTEGVFTEFSVGHYDQGDLTDMTAGPDGNVWFTEYYGNRIGRITMAGTIVPPTIMESFGMANMPLNGSTALSFTIGNPNASTTLTGVGFIDTLPTGLVVSTPNGVTGGCDGGTIVAVAGSGTVALTGAALAESSSCTLSVNVTGKTHGTHENIIGVTSFEGGPGGTASATVTVGFASATSGPIFHPHPRSGGH